MPMPLTGVGRSVWSVQFYQENDGVDFGSGANIDDLPSADCTIEFWARIPANVGNFTGLFAKAWVGGVDGWYVQTVPTGVQVVFYFDGTNITITATQTFDGLWRHYAVDWDVGTLTARLFEDGILRDTGVAVGNYQSDAAENAFLNAVHAMGTSDGTFAIGPIRLSNSRRYTGASFDPLRRINWPANDANAQLITRMNDGAGATVTDYSGNGYNGTITFGANTRWYNDPV